MRLREEGIVYVLDKTILTQGPQSERWFTSRCLPYVWIFVHVITGGCTRGEIITTLSVLLILSVCVFACRPSYL